MRRRTVDPLAPLKPVARLAAVGLVAAVGTLGAVHAHGQPAQDTASVSPASVSSSSSNIVSEASSEASTLLSAVHLPPGAVRLDSKPANAPEESSQGGDVITRTQWWSTNMSAGDVLSWVAEHPVSSTVATLQEWTGSGVQAPHTSTAIGFDGTSTGVLYELNVSVTPFTLSSGGTGIQVTASVDYRPSRSARETIPVTAKLVVTQTRPGETGNGGTVTTTDPGEIGRVAKIINGLPTAPRAPMNCPFDDGAGINLKFESASGNVLDVVTMETTGCTRASIVIEGAKQPQLESSLGAVQQTEQVIGAHWQFTL